MLEIVKTTLNIGAERPFKLLHVTDSHIAFDDEGQDCGRLAIFKNAEENFLDTAEYAKANGLTVLHTGDFFDFLSEKNFEFADKHLSELDYIYAAGNHDFCHCVGQATEDYEYKWTQIKRSAPHIRSNLYFDSRVINGVNIVTLDNSYYLITEGQVELLRAEAAKGYPIVLAMHVPLFTRKQAEARLAGGDPCAYLMGAPEEYTSKYPEYRRLQQTPDKATLNAIAYIKSEPLIKAIVVGHIHKNCEEMLDNGVVQITTAGGFQGFAREITII